MQLSVIVATRNRADMLAGCLRSIAASIRHAAPVAAEIVVIDNGSTDGTARIVADCARTCGIAVQHLHEPQPNASRARNRGIRAARGALLAFTDDDCRLSTGHVADLLRHDAGDTAPVLRGGRIERGDPTDLPLTINTRPSRIRWSRADRSARRNNIADTIAACNMAMRRGVAARIGLFDPSFGPGSGVTSGEDADYLFRAYAAGVTLEYVPDMTVWHHHGRKSPEAGRTLMRSYMIGSGALYAKHLLRDPNLCRPFLWDCRNAVRDILAGGNSYMPELGFSHADKVRCSIRGAATYLRHRLMQTARDSDPSSGPSSWSGKADHPRLS